MCESASTKKREFKGMKFVERVIFLNKFNKKNNQHYNTTNIGKLQTKLHGH